MTLTLRQHADQRITSLENERLSFWTHHRELADFILPRRYKWLITPNEMTKGSPINGRIIDSTGTLAARVLATGMAEIASPTKPWFLLKIDGYDTDETNPVTLWLSECQKRLMRVFHESNFYTSVGQLFEDLSVFNTAAMLIYEDYEDVIRCYNACCGEYYLANGARMDVTVFARKFVRSVAQMCEEWDEENLSENARRLYKQGGSSLQQEFVIAHLIEPNEGNFDGPQGVSKFFPIREMYWEWGSSNNIPSSGQSEGRFLSCKGFYDDPGVYSRWSITANDAYGRGPSMDALGDIKQLQQETKRKAQAIDKMVNPPMRADVQLKNQPASLIPGGVTYVTNMATSKGMEPMYQVMPPIQEMKEDIKEVQLRIQKTFHNDIFQMFQNLEAEPRSAAAIDARREEKLLGIGPVYTRAEREVLNKVINRTWNIMDRARLLPIAPPEIHGKPIKIEYTSILAQAQRAVETASIERLVGFAGNLAAIKPDVMDKVNLDQALDEMGNLLNVPPSVLFSDEETAKTRQARAQQQQQIQQMQVTDAAVNAAKTLSDTDVGGGVNALQAALQ